MKHRFSRIFLCLGAIALTASPSFAQPQAYKGWPGHDDISDLEQSFLNPPKGYGNVPFYWWPGDSLDMERLREQLEILSDASTDGLNVSYNHTHEEVERRGPRTLRKSEPWQARSDVGRMVENLERLLRRMCEERDRARYGRLRDSLAEKRRIHRQYSL